MTWKECQYLAGTLTGGVARLALIDPEGRPALLPLNYAMVEGDLVVRTADEVVVEAAEARANVGVLIDAASPDGQRLAWRVLAQGPIRSAGEDDLVDWSGKSATAELPPVAGEHYLRINPEVLTGTRYRLPDASGMDTLRSPGETMAATITSI